MSAVISIINLISRHRDAFVIQNLASRTSRQNSPGRFARSRISEKEYFIWYGKLDAAEKQLDSE